MRFRRGVGSGWGIGWRVQWVEMAAYSLRRRSNSLAQASKRVFNSYQWVRSVLLVVSGEELHSTAFSCGDGSEVLAASRRLREGAGQAELCASRTTICPSHPLILSRPGLPLFPSPPSVHTPLHTLTPSYEPRCEGRPTSQPVCILPERQTMHRP